MSAIGAGAGRLPAVGALALLCFIGLFWRMGACGIFDLDEGLYVAVAREMAITGDYVTPRVNHAAFYEKPAAAYWWSALAMRAFGTGEAQARLPNAIALTALVALIYAAGCARYGRRTGFLAAGFLATSPLVLGAGRQLTMDAQLTLWMAVALLAFHAAWNRTGAARTALLAVFWIACGLGVLTKGVVGALLPCAIAAIWLFVRRRQGTPVHVGPRTLAGVVGGLALLAAVAAPWHIAAWNAGGSAFVQEYLVRQHLQRFRGGDTAHLAPSWFFLPAFFLLAAPWGGFVPPALLARRTPQPGDTGATDLLKIWAIVVFVFFSASGSKLVSYILPMYPAAALLAAAWCDEVLRGERPRRPLTVALGLAFAVAAALLAVLLAQAPLVSLAERLSHRPVVVDADTAAMLAWGVRQLALLAAVCGAALLLTLRNRVDLALAAAIAGMGAFAGLAVADGLATVQSHLLAPLHGLARSAGERARPDEPILLAVGPPRRPSVFFYLPDRRFEHTRTTGPVIEAAASAGLPPQASTQAVVVLVRTDRIAELQAPPERTVTLEQRGKWSLVRVLPAVGAPPMADPPAR